HAPTPFAGRRLELLHCCYNPDAGVLFCYSVTPLKNLIGEFSTFSLPQPSPSKPQLGGGFECRNGRRSDRLRARLKHSPREHLKPCTKGQLYEPLLARLRRGSGVRVSIIRWNWCSCSLRSRSSLSLCSSCLALPPLFCICSVSPNHCAANLTRSTFER